MPAHQAEHQARQPDYGFSDRWLAESVRLRLRSVGTPAGVGQPAWSAAQLSAAENQARAVAGPVTDPLHGIAETRVLRWAALLAAHTELVAAMHGWRQRAGLVLFLMSALAFAGGLSAALGVMGNGQAPVNVLWALGTLLGINLLMLALWLISMLMAPGALSAGRLWFWLSARFYGRDALTLAQAFSSLSQRAGGTRWWLAGISHLVWSAALAGALAGLLVALSLRSYAFVWETTILPASVFNSVVQALAWLPSLAGFPMPDENTIRTAGLAGAGALTPEALIQSDEQRRAWAGWLCGAVLVYGVLPRLLLLALSAGCVARGLSRLRLDLHSAEWVALSERLSPASQSAGITDPAPRLSDNHLTKPAIRAAGHAPPVVVGFELSEQISWPPADWFPGSGSADKGSFVSAGASFEQVASRQQRTQVLQQLEQAPPRALMLAVDSAQTVDRGSLAWLSEATGRVLHVAVWLAGDGTEHRRSVWRQQLQTLGLLDSQVFDAEADARQWLELHS